MKWLRIAFLVAQAAAFWLCVWLAWDRAGWTVAIALGWLFVTLGLVAAHVGRLALLVGRMADALLESEEQRAGVMAAAIEAVERANREKAREELRREFARMREKFDADRGVKH